MQQFSYTVPIHDHFHHDAVLGQPNGFDKVENLCLILPETCSVLSPMLVPSLALKNKNAIMTVD